MTQHSKKIVRIPKDHSGKQLTDGLQSNTMETELKVGHIQKHNAWSMYCNRLKNMGRNYDSVAIYKVSIAI